MISDIETILAGFVGAWKPGIEEQSIRMAHAVALQGDTATASNILRFIAIPEPMKLQILGASLSAPAATAPNPVSAPSTIVDVAGPAKIMPAPLMAESAPDAVQTMAIPAVSESDVVAAVPVEPVALPAFSVDLAAVQQEAVPTPVVPVESEPVTPVAIPAADKLAVANTSLPVHEETPKPLPSTPVGSLPFERQELFDRAFASVQSQSAVDTSKPMVKDADNIPVIHTYAEPEQSARETAATQAVQNQKGLKLFQALQLLLRRAVASADAGLRASAVAQWDRLNTEFPDYKTFHRMDWSAMEGMVAQLKDPNNVPIEKPKEPVAVTDTPMVSVVEPIAITTPETITPAPVDSVAGGGYFSHTTKAETKPAKPVAPIPETGTISVATPAPVSVSDGVAATSGGGYFARKTTTKPVEPAPVVETPSKQSEEIESFTLKNGLEIKKNMTITGESIYRVQSIQKTNDTTNAIFTDEINTYTVPVQVLSDALDNPDAQPDTFFAQYSE